MGAGTKPLDSGVLDATAKELSLVVSDILEASFDDIRDGMYRIVDVGLRAELAGVPMAHEIMVDQLKARLTVHAIRANSASWEFAGKVVKLVLTTVGHALLSGIPI